MIESHAVRPGHSSGEGGHLRRAHSDHDAGSMLYNQLPPFGRPPAWTEQSLCHDLAPAESDRLFFADNAHYPREARQMCAICPVKAECLETGKTEIYGMYGGLIPLERFELFGRPVRHVLYDREVEAS